MTPRSNKANKVFSIAFLKQLLVASLVGMLAGACNNDAPNVSKTTDTDEKKFQVAMILVGARNDSGWNQAHYEATKYVMEKQNGIQFKYVDQVNPGDRPNVKASQIADELIAKGAKLLIFNSDDFKEEALATAKKYPNVSIIHASGDYAWKEGKNFKNQPNLGNIMPS